VEIVPILVRPRYAGNVGAAARACANFGITRMALVAPECSLDEHDFLRMAMGAERRVRIDGAATLEAALAGIEVAVVTTSARDRDVRAILTPAEVRERLLESAPASVAVVFGPERRGLSRGELHRCQLRCSIPTDPGFPVLNLAQAVAIVLAAATAARVTAPQPANELDRPAPTVEFDAALAHLHEALLGAGFLDPDNPTRVMNQVRRLLGRAVPTRRELAIVRGLAAHVAWLAQRAGRAPR
jgi:TrmH family RNA methyltransferase